VLKLEKDHYGLRDGGLTWFKYIKKGLKQGVLNKAKLNPASLLKAN
jgi:hypothetical protein